jgi:hypothetical protein
MPTIERNGASIYFEEHGRGFPILTFAPAGLQSGDRRVEPAGGAHQPHH